jgi:hypothetical protein
MAGEVLVDAANEGVGAPKADIKVKVVGTNMQGRPWLALALLGAALLVIFGTGGYWLLKRTAPGYSGGGAAACVGVLILLALVVERPELIMDDSPDAGGEPSTMRILTLIVVLTFAVLVLRTGWNTQSLPTLENQGNWIWLITAAFGGKALQKFAEVREPKK